MARPANPNKEKIADVKTQLKDTNKLIRAGETASKKKEKLEERLAKLTGDTVAAPKGAKTQKTSKKDKEKVSSKKDKKEKTKDKEKAKQVVKKRGRPRKTDEDEA